jgi:hypothetical protein
VFDAGNLPELDLFFLKLVLNAEIFLAFTSVSLNMLIIIFHEYTTVVVLVK